ncbi:MAG: hypothetical protein K5871_02450 [Lachnospiraceae bacterium]|nr:hypothetical protein [Lachnospiraceae bacterium]
MKNKNLILLKMLLDSTSPWNVLRHCKDKKKKGRIIGAYVGLTILYLMLMAYCLFSCIGYGRIGLAEIIPAICALTISLIAVFFTFFKTNGYLFNFKEYDMLMSLPFDAKTVAGCKFLYMYLKSMPWYMSISVAMLIGYELYVTPSVVTWLVWMILTFILPVIPMLAAAFAGYIITRISAGFRKTNIVQTVLSFGVVILAFSSRFFIESMIKEDKVEETLVNASESINNVTDKYLPAKWFQLAVTQTDILSILLLVVISIALFEILFFFVGRSYREINSKLKNHAASRKFSMTGQKSRSVLNSIAFKEFRRMTGSTIYMTNGSMGEFMALIIGIAVLFIDMDTILYKITEGAPVTKEMLYPAIALIVYFCIGMVATTVMSPSLEGKNYWIVKSLPISGKVLYQGKMLFNMYMTVPFASFAIICICISTKAPLLTSILSLILGVCLCGFSTTWGCVCGIKHMRLDWENEVEVIKQGAGVAIYMFPNMIATMLLVVLVVALGTKIDQNIIVGALILIVSALAMIFYKKAIKLAEKQA